MFFDANFDAGIIDDSQRMASRLFATRQKSNRPPPRRWSGWSKVLSGNAEGVCQYWGGGAAERNGAGEWPIR